MSGEDRVSTGYIKKLSSLPLVHEQGDGVKSFIGCLLTTLIMPRFIILLDEPEAFLHPPQARHLGKLLAQEHNKNQLIVSTHSGDIVRGILDSNINNLNILRITKSDNINHAYKLNSEDIKLFWSDPILRFSNILDALFHEAVIICESDTDCRFYSSILSAIFDSEAFKSKRKPDLFFASSGGKNRIPTIVKALIKIKIDTRVIVDFDLLFEEEKTKELYEILGGNWNLIMNDYTQVKSFIEKESKPIEVNIICNSIGLVLEKVRNVGEFIEADKKSIRSHLKTSNALLNAKINGVDFLNDNIKENFTNLLNNLKQVGIWLVPYGELESFDKSVPGHGTAWVAKVLEKNILEASELERARNFMKDIAGL